MLPAGGELGARRAAVRQSRGPLRCAQRGQDNSPGKAVPSLQLSIIPVGTWFKPGAGAVPSTNPP